MKTVIYDDFDDPITVESESDTLIVLTVEEQTAEAQANLNRGATIEVADALYEAAGETRKSGVYAESITFNEGLLRLAAIHEVEVTFAYAKGDGAIIEHRRLVPSEVKSVLDHLTFIGYDPDRDDVRAFRVDRIRGKVGV